MIDIDDVRSLIVASPPFPDESFHGFFARTLAKTAARSFNSGLALAKVEPRPRTKSYFFSQDELANLATLLNTDKSLLMKMSLPDVSRKRNDLQSVRSFFGTRVPFSMLDHERRSVSPTALGLRSYHRAMWTLRLFHLDGETLEPLISRCPMCNQQLGWKRSVHPAACDTCVDSVGRSNVDLRDFRQAPAELEDPDAYRYVYSLVDPREAVEVISPGEFARVSRAVRFEAIFVMIRWMLQKQITRNRLSPAKDVAYWMASPSLVASAGRYFLAGSQGLREFEVAFPGMSPERSFGVVVSLERYVGAGVKALFESVLRPSRAQILRPGMRSPQWLSKRYEIPRSAVASLAEPDVSDRWSRKSVLVREDKVKPLAQLYRDCVSYKRCSDILGFSSPGITSLIAMGVFQDVQESIRFTLPNREFLSGASVTAALKALDRKAQSNANFQADMTFRQVSSRTPYALFYALAAALDDEIDVCYSASSLPCWAEAYGPCSARDLTALIERIHLARVLR